MPAELRARHGGLCGKEVLKKERLISNIFPNWLRIVGDNLLRRQKVSRLLVANYPLSLRSIRIPCRILGIRTSAYPPNSVYVAGATLFSHRSCRNQDFLAFVASFLLVFAQQCSVKYFISEVKNYADHHLRP